MIFRKPQNGYIEDSSSFLSWLWVLLLGPIYWAVRGVWTHVAVNLALVLITAGLCQLIYPFFTYSILRKHYLKIGWEPVD
jgi:hypothetical protein